ncbi:MAG: hypothetical protein R6V19_02780, partial [Armatimonadota bacterium]
MASSATGAPQVVIDEVTVPQDAVRGQKLQVSYRIAARGDDVSVTTFAVSGDIQEAPDEWWKNSLRSDPKYQVFHTKLQGEPMDAIATFVPGDDTQVGPYTVFVAVMGTTEKGWHIERLGAFELQDAPRVSIDTLREGVAIWPGEIPDTAAALADLLRDLGLEASIISTEDLKDPGSRLMRECGLLIFPDGGAYPAVARSAIEAWREAGGSFLCLGAPGFPVAVRETEGGVQPRTWPVADMQSGDTTQTFHSEQADGTVEYVSPGAAETSRALKVFFHAEAGWFYATLRAPEPMPAEGRYLEFMARGDETTDRLCLEIVGKDGSRWKYFVELDTQWEMYSVPIRDFAIYVRSDQNPEQRVLDPESVADLKFGIYRNLYEEPAEHIFFIDEVRLSSVAHRPVPPLYEHAQKWAGQYTSLHAQPPLDLFGLVERTRKLEGTSRLRAADSQAVIAELHATVEDAREIVPQIRDIDDDRRVLNDPVTSRWLRLIETETVGDATPAVVGGAVLTHSGTTTGSAEPRRGFRWGYIGIDAARVAGDEQLAAAFTSLVKFLTAPTAMYSPTPEFAAEGNALRQTWTVPVMHLGREARTVSVTLQAPSGDAYSSSARELEPGETCFFEIAVPPAKQALNRLGGMLSVQAGGETIDRVSVEADVQKTLQIVGEWLTTNQKPEGNYSTWYYADVYGARAMRVLSELTGEDRYRQSGLKMLDMLVENQREDGGWWVGYGPPGEAVFVADDGCIALALVQMAPYMDPERKAAYLEAARKHVAFREDFRQTPEVVQQLQDEYGEGAAGILQGGLGIGYVLRDYFGEQRYESPQREMRQKPWTLHCSLAFLGGLCSLQQGPQYCRLAAKDTDWFLDRVEDGSDSVRTGYANEAAIWMYDTLDDDALHSRLQNHLQEQFFAYVQEAPEGWWLGSDGRYALALPGLVYCQRDLPDGEQLTPHLASALWGMCTGSSPDSLPRILARYQKSNIGGVTMYACFASVGLAELLEPYST